MTPHNKNTNIEITIHIICVSTSTAISQYSLWEPNGQIREGDSDHILVSVGTSCFSTSDSSSISSIIKALTLFLRH